MRLNERLPGPGEPFVTAAGVLGLMSVWRAFYTCYLDYWNVTSYSGSPLNRYQARAVPDCSLKHGIPLAGKHVRDGIAGFLMHVHRPAWYKYP